jgi:hypothetical protein
MKKILILTVAYYFAIVGVVHAQTNIYKNDTICYCQISNSQVKDSIAAYLARNYSYGTKGDGATLIKFYLPEKNNDYYKFVISKILFRSELKKHTPKTYTLIKDIPVLIYGTKQTSSCITKRYKSFYRLISHKFLIDDAKYSAKFDPEILEIKMKGDSIISRKEVWYQPLLTHQ